MENIVIVGAGIAGLTLGDTLVRSGYPVTIIEKEKQIGGLARSFCYGDFTFDIGPHRFHSYEQEIIDFIHDILDRDVIHISRYSGVSLFNKYYDWPLKPNLFFNLPLNFSLKAGWDLIKRQFIRSSPQESFENYIMDMYGPTLYDCFFKDYTEKFLGIPTRDIHADWASTGIERAIIDEKVALRKLSHIIKIMILPKTVKSEFLYPVNGMRAFVDHLGENIESRAGKILTDSVITSLDSSGERIRSLECNGDRITTDKLVWTAPLYHLTNLLDLKCPKLEYLSLLLFNIEIEGPIPNNYQWCYFGEKDVVFNRVSNPSLLSGKMAPEGKIGLCVEVTCYQGDENWNEPEHLQDTIIEDLLRVGYITKKNTIKKIHIENIPDAYPVYDINYKQKLQDVKSKLEQFTNLFLSGRSGLFWYNNMDHSIKEAKELAGRLVRKL